MTTVKVSEIFSTSDSKPGIFSMIEFKLRITLSLKARMGYILATVSWGLKSGMPSSPELGFEPPPED